MSQNKKMGEASHVKMHKASVITASFAIWDTSG